MKLQKNPRRIFSSIFPYILLLPVGSILVVVLLYPALYIIWFSLLDAKLTALKQNFCGLENYKTILTSDLFKLVLKNSFVWTFGSIGLQFVIGFSTALILDREETWANIIRGVLLVSWVMPGIAIAFIWRWILNADYGILNFALVKLGILDSYFPWLANPNSAMLSIILANSWKGFPFWMIMLSAGLKAIGLDIYDAAAIDGTNKWQLLWYIKVPLLKLPLFVTSILAFIWTFNYFDLIWGMTRGGPVDATKTVPLYIYDTAFVGFKMGKAAAASVILLVMMTVLTIFYARMLHIKRGYTE